MRAAFFVVNLVIVLLIGFFLWKEWRPPWKPYQERFRSLTLKKWKTQYKEARERFDSAETQKRLRESETALRRQQEAARQEPLRSEREAWERDLSRIRSELTLARDRFQKARYQEQKLEHRILLAPRKDDALWRRSLEQQKPLTLALQKEVERLDRERLRLESRQRELDEPSEAVRQDLSRLRAPLAALETRRQALRRRPMEVRQTVVEALGVVDRCQSCHLGIDDPSMSGAPVPFGFHADLLDKHPPERFGCTPCHGGQGRATSLKEAHGEESGWLSPLPGPAHREAGCGLCHKEANVPQAPTLSAGRKLLTEAGCVSCHKHQEYPRAVKIGPDLSSIGSKVRFGWLARWLKRPKDWLPATRMPNFLLSEKEIQALSEFLWTLKGPVAKVQPGEPALELGEKLFKESRCVSCHGLNGRGGTLGPDLGKVGSKVKGDWLAAYLRSPRPFQPNTRMPRYRLTEMEAQSLADYLLSEYQDFESPAVDEARPTGDPALIAEGKRLASYYGCYGCHDIPGIAGPEPGAELTEIGAKRPEHLDFGLLAVGAPQRNLAHWLDLKLKDPRIFRDTLKMPQYDFTDQERQALVTALLSFNGRRVPESYLVGSSPPPGAVLGGEFGRLARDLNCLVCHRIRGQGGTLAPDLSLEGNQVQPAWLRRFLAEPDVIRPVLVERMPKFRLSPREIEIIARYVQSTLVSEAIPLSASSGRPSDALIRQGKGLYQTHGCQACHQIGLAGGSIGPNLTHVGSRLEPGWIARWLKNPQAYRPETVEPRLDLTDGEIDALTAFLGTLL